MIESQAHERWLDAGPYPALRLRVTDETVAHANPALVEALGWSVADLRRDPSVLLSADDWSLLVEILGWESSEICSQAVEVTLRTRDGQARSYQLHLLPDPSPDHVSAAIIDPWTTEEKGPAASLSEISSAITASREPQAAGRRTSPYIRLRLRFAPDGSSATIEKLDAPPAILDPEAPVPPLQQLLHPEDWQRLQVERSCQRPGSAPRPLELELRMVSPEGLDRWYDTVLRPAGVPDSDVWILEGWEITGRHQEEDCLRLTSHLMSILSVGASFEDLAPDALEYLRQRLGVEVACVQYERPDGRVVTFQAGGDSDEQLDLYDMQLAKMLLARLREQPASEISELPTACHRHYRTSANQSCWVNRLEPKSCPPAPTGQDIPCAKLAARVGARSFALLPIRAAAEPIGLLGLFDPRPERFDEEFIGQIEDMVYAIGSAIQRENTLQIIQQSEERYRGLFESSRDGIAIRNLDGEIVAANQAYLKLARLSLRSLKRIPRPRFISLAGDPETRGCYPGDLLQNGFTEDQEMIVMGDDGRVVPVLGREWTLSDENGRPMRAMEFLRDISEAKRAESERVRLVTAIEQADEMVVITDPEGVVQYVNPAFTQITGYAREDAIGQGIEFLRPKNTDAELHGEMWRTIRSGRTWKGRFTNQKRSGELFQEEATISPIFDSAGRITNFVGVKRDVTELVELEAQLLQSQKLESIGRLAAGIAHEINTPSQYVTDNVCFLEDGFRDLLGLLREAMELAERSGDPTLRERLEERSEEIDLEYLTEQIPAALEQSGEGMARIAEIVGAMKNFSHPGSAELEMTDLHEAIRSTLTVARNEYKYVADLELDLDPQVGTVPCLVNEFNQVMLNLVVNAKHAIEEKMNGHEERGHIRVRTRRHADHVEIRVEDDGIGIAEEHQTKVFDQFFTTKAVGHGTGQGLSLSRDIIVNRHGGEMDFESTPGVGTAFVLRLPLERSGVPELVSS